MVRKPGRPNSFERNVVPLRGNARRSPLTPPAMLTKSERLLFIEIVSTNPHLVDADGPIVAAYSQAMVKTYRLAKKPDFIAEWEKAGRLTLALARSLRLTPQAAIDPQALGRHRRDQADPGGPAMRDQNHLDDDDGDDGGRR
jgi:hypothetical protein